MEVVILEFFCYILYVFFVVLYFILENVIICGCYIDVNVMVFLKI